VATVAAIAKALGAEIGVVRKRTVNALRQEQARKKARKLAGVSQASAALEGQGARVDAVKRVEADIMARLLSGPRLRLWT